MLNPAAQVALVIFVLIFGLLMVGMLAGVLITLIKLTQKIDDITVKAEPAIVKLSDTLDTVQRVTSSVGERADHILSRGEDLTDRVSSDVEKTATVVQQAITTPLINLSSWIAGLSKGVSTFGGAVRGKNGHSGDSARKE
jgi:hypothetical protein